MSAPAALQAGSLASAVSQGTTSSQPLALKLELGHREPLQGKELEAFYASRAAHALLEEEEEEPQPSLTPRYLPDSPSCGRVKHTEQRLLKRCLAMAKLSHQQKHRFYWSSGSAVLLMASQGHQELPASQI